ncbi:distal membrane-arm assembly complex protein 1 [Chelydra serpentina]|uniref:Distal membrane-arm assembly complex protein 1 n=1 Tax=Chelydra serpentina TaxID=8475 RepID=A0A8T1TAB9_CHESE|nr:distal membrane-arm assembly complex protein 1 [Chelydra serpentina]
MSKALEEGKAVAPPTKLVFGNCWGCRILSGSALIGAGYWVYLGPRRVLGRGFTPSPWTIFQLSFAVSECASGVTAGSGVGRAWPHLHGNRPPRQ